MENIIQESIIRNLPQFDPNTKYWLVRGEGGIFYDDFLINNYIAIGWNEISAEEVDQNVWNSDTIRAKLISENGLAFNSKNKRKMGSAAKQMIKFQNDIRPGHIILVPSQNSERFSVGEVVGEVYSEEKEEKLLACPYVKRRKIKWIGKFNRFKADPLLQKVVYAAHTVSDITQYKSYINRATFDTYVEGDSMHMTFHVKHAEGIDLEILSNLLKSYNELNKLLYPEDKVKVRLNIQSPGPIEIVGMAMTVGSIAGLIWNNAPVSSKIASGVKETLKYGGKFSKQKDGFSIEIPNRKESENAQKNEERRLAMEEENHEIKKELLKEELRAKKIENAKSSLDLIEKVNSKLSKEAVNSILEFVDNFEKLGGEYPEEFTKALEKTDLEENKKTK
ncbi:hypothetical protein [Enterococcus gallinarum]|uniref:hypothetical protein n=1 Tax=Enterococcus gallinarum TaxID=1353 RepID=UPI0011C91B40|nr:hypothetical protein [Enterococcus gallinarum]